MDGQPALTITEESRGDELRLVVEGELDMATAPQLMERVNGCEVDGSRGLALEMSGVSFMDVAGMRVLLEAARRCHGSNAGFVILNPRAIASRVFRLAAVDQELEIRFDAPRASDDGASPGSADGASPARTPTSPAP